MIKILILHPLPIKPSFDNDKIEVVIKNWKTLPNIDILKKELKNIDAVISLLSHKLTKDILKLAPKLKIIANYAVGYNNIDLDYCKSNGIVVTNTPDILTSATAEIALTLLLSVMRKIVPANKFLYDGKFKGWGPKLFLGDSIEGKTVSIIGAGRIGLRFVEYLAGFKVKEILYHNRTQLSNNIEKKYGIKYSSIDQIAQKSDIISIHAPLNDQSYHLLNDNFFSKIKKGVYIINTARGDIIDEDSLIKNIDNIGGVALDVFSNEPQLNKKFLKYEKILVTPHIGSAEYQTRINMGKLCYSNVENILFGEKPITPVF